MRRPLASAEEIVAAVAELADDGFCPRRHLAMRLPALGERELRRGLARALRRGLLLERRGPDGALYFALTGEGWAAIGRG